MASSTRTAAGAGVAGRVNAALGALSERRHRYRTYRVTLAELSALTPRELDDLGIHRTELRRIAYEAAYHGR